MKKHIITEKKNWNGIDLVKNIRNKEILVLMIKKKSIALLRELSGKIEFHFICL